MKQVYLNSNSIIIEKENIIPMINGFYEDSYKTCSIFTAHKNSKSMQNYFYNYPKLITQKQNPPRNEYPLRNLGRLIQGMEFSYNNNYIAILDTKYHLKTNDLNM